MLDLGWHHGGSGGSLCSDSYLRRFFDNGAGKLCTINVFPRVHRISGHGLSTGQSTMGLQEFYSLLTPNAD
jgi:hypothetical protein